MGLGGFDLCNQLTLPLDKSSKKIAPKAPTRRAIPADQVKRAHDGCPSTSAVQVLRQELDRTAGQHWVPPTEVFESQSTPSPVREIGQPASDVRTNVNGASPNEVNQPIQDERFTNSTHEGHRATVLSEHRTPTKESARERDKALESSLPALPDLEVSEAPHVPPPEQDSIRNSRTAIISGERVVKRRRVEVEVGEASGRQPSSEVEDEMQEAVQGEFACQGESALADGLHHLTPISSLSNQSRQPIRRSKGNNKPRSREAFKAASDLEYTLVGSEISTPNTTNEEGASVSQAYNTKTTSLRRKSRRNVEGAALEVVTDAITGSSRRRLKESDWKEQNIPEATEAVRIESSAVKMVDLCKDSRSGQRSLREQEMRQLDEKAKAAKRQSKLAKLLETREDTRHQRGLSKARIDGRNIQSELQPLDGTLASEEHVQGDNSHLRANEPRQVSEHRRNNQDPGSSHLQPTTRIVNGEIVLDESSLRIDRHANAVAAQLGDVTEAVEESEMTRHVTAGSWLRREKSGSWNGELTDQFYEGLRMFGTDFGMISKMFVDKSRHAVKRKFCLEEKLSPARVEATLRGERLQVNLQEFSQRTNTIYEDPRELEREMAEDRQRLEAEQAREKQVLEEIKQRRAEETALESAAVVAGDSPAREYRGRRTKALRSSKSKSQKLGRMTQKAKARPNK